MRDERVIVSALQRPHHTGSLSLDGHGQERKASMTATLSPYSFASFAESFANFAVKDLWFLDAAKIKVFNRKVRKGVRKERKGT
jgi:hypothetical protein